MTRREQELTDQLAQCRRDLTTAQQENALLRQKIDLLVRRVFGASSERLAPAQLELLLQLPKSFVPEVPATTSEKLSLPPKRSPRNRTRRLPENLPVVEEVIEPAVVKAEPAHWRCIGQEVSEQLDYEPARFFRRRTLRKKYVHRVKLDAAPVIAPLPERLQDRSLPAPGLLAHILISKYCDHLPLYRQEQIFARRHQVQLPRQTLARWVELAADWLQPIYEAIRTGVMAGGYVQVDETPVNYLKPGHGRTRQGYFWTASRPKGDVFFRWETSRATACLDQVVPLTFTGTLQSDGYPAYRAFVNGRKEVITLAGCWAHVRRKFYEASETSPQMSGWLLRQIQHLYRLEARTARTLRRSALAAGGARQPQPPIVARLEKVLLRLKLRGRYLPQSSLGQAIDYALGQWPTLTIYLNDGRVEIDNNLVENAIRPTAIGKKNWLFIGDAGAGQRSAIIYTVIESCRRRDLDPYAYLREVLTRLPQMTNHQIPEVLPAAWGKAQRTLQVQTAS